MGASWGRLRETFGVDLRSLAVLRMGLGLMILVDLTIRAVTLRAHYTDDGVLPVADQMRRWFADQPGRFSFHMWSGELNVQILLFVVAALFAIALTVGYRTQLALLGSVVLMISLQNRNAEIETGGDYLLRLVCLWGLFLPLGARCSLDRRAGRTTSWRPFGGTAGENNYFSFATVGLFVQLFVVYFFSALLKSHPIWRQDFTAIHYALHIDAYDTSVGEWLRQYPRWTAAFTRGTVGFESIAPWLLVAMGLSSMLPRMGEVLSWQSPTRTFVVIAFILFHAGLALCLSLGTFAWFAMAIWLGMFPTWAWDTLLKNDAVARLGAMIVRWESSNDRDSSVNPAAPPRPSPLIFAAVQGLALGTALLVLLINVEIVHRPLRPYLRGGPGLLEFDLRRPINFARLDQNWGLFTPYPRRNDGYYVVLATLKDGAQLDMMKDDQVLDWKKPADVSGSYPTFRWRKYFRNIRRPSGRADLPLYSNYQCRQWNRAHGAGKSMERVEIYFMRRDTLARGGHSAVKKIKLWNQSCGDGSRA